jgi:hypothetical protein
MLGDVRSVRWRCQLDGSNLLQLRNVQVRKSVLLTVSVRKTAASCGKYEMYCIYTIVNPIHSVACCTITRNRFEANKPLVTAVQFEAESTV